jgi:hypothetical protein
MDIKRLFHFKLLLDLASISGPLFYYKLDFDRRTLLKTEIYIRRGVFISKGC